MDSYLGEMIVGRSDWNKLSLKEMQWKNWEASYVIQIAGRTCLWVLPIMPLIIVPWTKLRWRLLGLIAVIILVLIPFRMPPN
jgi:hypothetical protein